MPVDAFLAQMERYNKIVEAKDDEQFGKAIPEDAVAIGHRPLLRHPPVAEGPPHHGRRQDRRRHPRARRAPCGPSEGSTPPGEITGGVHRRLPPGLLRTADCLVNGRIAGQKAAAAEPVA